MAVTAWLWLAVALGAALVSGAAAGSIGHELGVAHSEEQVVAAWRVALAAGDEARRYRVALEGSAAINDLIRAHTQAWERLMAEYWQTGPIAKRDRPAPAPASVVEPAVPALSGGTA